MIGFILAAFSKIVSTMTIKPQATLENDATSGMTVTPNALNPSNVEYSSSSSPPGTDMLETNRDNHLTRNTGIWLPQVVSRKSFLASRIDAQLTMR